MDKQTKKLFWETIAKYNRFLLCLHANADADSLCSNIAMAEILKSEGKSVTILAGKNDSFSVDLQNLPEWLGLVSQHKVEEIDFGAYDCFVLLDAHDEKRLYDTEHMPLAKMVIDHHVGNNITGTDFVIVDSSYSSTSQMIYELASDKVSPSKDYLEAIYIGMYADTGGFKYNVSPRVHEACAEIMSRVDVSEKLKKYTQSTTPDDIVILSIATTNLKSFVVQGIRFYITTISQDDIVGKLQNPNLWSSNIATRVLSDLNDVDVLCVASEKESGVWRIRFRSFIEGSHARILAESFSGGGHNKAAGGVIFTNDHRAVLAEIKKHAEKLFS